MMKRLIRSSLFCLASLSGMLTQSVLAQETPAESRSPLRKGVAFVGFSGGASLRESENVNALVVTIQEQAKKGYNLIFSGGYLVRPEFAIGGALRFDRSRESKRVIDADGVATDVREAGSIITTALFVKNFIPLTANKRINLYNIGGLVWVADRNSTESMTQNVLTRTYTNKNSFQLGISPGIQVFVVDGFATEVGVNVAGFSATNKEVMVNGVPDSRVSTFDLDFRVNILSLNISFFYYFPTRRAL